MQFYKIINIAIILILLTNSLTSTSYADNIEHEKNIKTTSYIIKDNLPELNKTSTKKIINTIDAYTLTADDNSVIELTGIYYPDENTDSKYYLKAKKILENELTNEKIQLYQVKSNKAGFQNRMGHLRAHIIKSKNNLWIQGELINQGLAIVKPNIYNPEMISELYKIEENAKTQNKGIWADDKYKIITPKEAPNYISEYKIIEGKIRKIATIKNDIYLNFGNNWRDDFTIIANSKIRKQFSINGVNLNSLANKTIRIRGYVNEYYGPMINLEQTEQLQIIDKDKNITTISSTKFKGFGHIKAKKMVLIKNTKKSQNLKTEEINEE